jgi:predicted aminopeptidase
MMNYFFEISWSNILKERHSLYYLMEMNKLMPLFVLSILVSISLSLTGCATDVGYLWKQGGYLLRYSSGARDIDSLLKDDATTVEVRAFLKSVKDIKKFAVEEIGLKGNDSYTKYKWIDRDYLVDVVQACDAASFNAYLWSYPFVGKLPYKGFYERADAIREKDRLEKQGYDVIVRKTDAFSTLGLLKDPVYSFMQRYSTFELASLIIHEQTHATIFLKGQARFNEELASFVGDEGALLYIRKRFGPDSGEYRRALSDRADSELFMSFIRGLTSALDALYSSALSRQEKIDRKAEIIDSYKARFKTEYAPRFTDPDYRKASDRPINNAYLSLFDLYSKEIPLLYDYYARECGSDLKSFMQKVTRLSKSPGDLEGKIRLELGLESNAPPLPPSVVEIKPVNP